jgi:glucose-1-phosphate adenylyltransferase
VCTRWCWPAAAARAWGQLTDHRAKPALPFAGKLNIIDFALSNCVNSGIRRIGVLTQYKAQSLIRHIERGWGFLQSSLGEFIDIVPAQQQMGDAGTAAPPTRCGRTSNRARGLAPLVLVLAGDHVYKMDYARLLAEHVDSGADATVACVEVPLDEARHFGVMAGRRQSRGAGLHREALAAPEPCPGKPDRALASMGIYVFDTSSCSAQLAAMPARRLATRLRPRPAAAPGAPPPGAAHRFADSVRQHGGDHPTGATWAPSTPTGKPTWTSRMWCPSWNLYDDDWPILSVQRQVPPAKFVFDDDGRRGMAVDSLVSGGCIVSGATVRRSVLFSKVRVDEGSVVEDSVVLPNVRIGRRVVLKRVIVDKGCVLPDGFGRHRPAAGPRALPRQRGRRGRGDGRDAGLTWRVRPAVRGSGLQRRCGRGGGRRALLQP